MLTVSRGYLAAGTSPQSPGWLLSVRGGRMDSLRPSGPRVELPV